MARGVPLLAARVKARLRLVVAHALYHAGILGLVQRLRLRRRAVVLMYHRVLSETELSETGSNAGIIVSKESFEQHLTVLAQRFHVLTVEEFAEHLLQDKPFPDFSCLITFDDGWGDTFENAWPLLERASIPSLVFLPVNFIGTDRRFWRETLTRLIARAVLRHRRSPHRSTPVQAILREMGLDILDVPDADPRAAVSEALDALKGTDPALLQAAIGRLQAELGPDTGVSGGTDRFMTWAEVEFLSSRGVAFGGHGAEHLLLDRISDERAGAEIEAAMADVSSKVPMGVSTFSYPNGNWTPAIAEKVCTAGFRLAFTTEAGSIRSGDNPYSLRRVNINEGATHTTPLFLARVLGLM